MVFVQQCPSRSYHAKLKLGSAVIKMLTLDNGKEFAGRPERFTQARLSCQIVGRFRVESADIVAPTIARVR